MAASEALNNQDIIKIKALNQRNVVKGSEVVGTIAPPLGVRVPFLTDDAFTDIATLPHGYKWAKKSPVGGHKLRAALDTMAGGLNPEGGKCFHAQPESPSGSMARESQGAPHHF